MAEEKKVAFDNFIKKYDALKTNDERKTMLSHIITVEYMPYMDKVKMCNRIISASCFKWSDDMKSIEGIHIDSPSKYCLFVVSVIAAYSCLEIDFKNCVDIYDELDKRGLVELMFNSILASEISSCQTILNMCYDDFMANNYETKAYVSKLANSLKESFVPALQTITNEFLAKFSDEDKKTFITKLNRMLK